MIMPRKGEEINVVPFGRAVVEKVLSGGQALVTVDRVFKTSEGEITNQLVVELHPVWLPSTERSVI